MKNNAPLVVKSIGELHTMLGLPKPRHPLISIYRFDQITNRNEKLLDYFCPQFYSIAIKKNFKGKVRYGQSFYDFDEGTMSFIGPGQLLAQTAGDNTPEEGFCLLFHPDFLAGYPLASKIRNYGFFSYELNEALHLSADEEMMVGKILSEIEWEYGTRIDALSQDVMITQIELLLHYCQRFYNRQFITRKLNNNQIFVQFEQLLEDYFSQHRPIDTGLPTVQYFAGQLHLSANYLSDLIRASSGKTVQVHIQDIIIEKAKNMLSTSALTVAEIAYHLGFEHPQSLNRLFKKKMHITPVGFRQSFN